MNMKQIGKRIAILRKSNNYTQETLAEKLGISPQAISKWETGMGLPETSMLMTISELFNMSIDDILQPDKKSSNVYNFMVTNQTPPIANNLDFIPRVERWEPPENCDMWYSFPTMIATALCSIEAYESGNFETLTMETLNHRYYDIMHITGIGYGFLWNTPRHIIEELWKIHDNADMADRAMKYYGRNYLWLTNENSTREDIRRFILWSISNGRPVIMDHAGDMPEYDLITGYADSGDTLIGWSHCMECAVKKDEQRRFVNPARWDEIESFRVLIMGDRVEPTYTDADSIAFAIEILSQNGKASCYSEKDQLYVGDTALDMWLAACDTLENTNELCHINDIYSFALYKNTINTAQSVATYFKGLDARSDKKVHDLYCQINIATDRLIGSRKHMDDTPVDAPEYLERCREHIKFIKQHRADMRVWLRELDEHFKGKGTNNMDYQPYG